VLARLRRVPFAAQVLLALVLGVVLGLVARDLGPVADGTPNWLTSTLATIGSTFVTLLKVLVPPLIVTAVIVSIANLKKVTNAARLAGQTLLWFAITALIAVAIGIGLGLLTQPGRNSSVDAASAQDVGTTGGWWDFLTGLVPGNILGLQASAGEGGSIGLSFNVLQLIVISVAIGIAALKVGEAAEPFVGFVRGALAVVQKVLWWVILLAPIGTLGLIGNAVATYGWESLGSVLPISALDCKVLLFNPTEVAKFLKEGFLSGKGGRRPIGSEKADLSDLSGSLLGLATNANRR